MDSIVDFIIIGAAKCGTTAALHNLSKHPKIHMPQVLEPHFFDLCWSMGEARYRKIIGERPPDKLVGEKTPSYISFFPAHRNMHLFVPDAKLILFVRNPITRAFSNWNHIRLKIKPKVADGEWSLGVSITEGDSETSKTVLDKKVLSFPDMVAQALANMGDVQKLHDKVSQDPDKPTAVDASFMNIVYRGLYINQIENLLKFFPKEQLYIAVMERVKSNMRKEYDKILAFLDLEPDEAVGHDLIAGGGGGPVLGGYDGNVIDEDTKRLLDIFYRPHNDRLRKFMDDDISEWAQ